MTFGRLQAVIDALEREAGSGVRSFAEAEAALGRLLEQEAVALCHVHDLYTRPLRVNGVPRAPLLETPSPSIDRARDAIAVNARALAFVRALLRGLHSREAELRAEAFR